MNKAKLLTLLTCALALSSCKTLEPKISHNDWRSLKPLSEEALIPQIPKFKSYKLENGLSVFVVESKKLPLVHVQFATRVGSAQESAAKAGLANLTTEMLGDGAGPYNSLQLEEAFGMLGTTLALDTNQDGASAGFSVLTKNLASGVQLLAKVIREPRFTVADFKRAKQLQLSSIQASLADPSTLASEQFFKLAYGENHPYGHPVDGTINSIKKLKVEDVRLFWRENVSPQNSAIIFSGDINTKTALELARKYFIGWTNTTKALKAVADPREHAKMQVKLVSRPNSPQSVLIMGRPLVKAGSPELYPYIVLNELVGGAFTSRLNMNLRENKAWTYGVRSKINPMFGLGPFYIKTDIQKPYTPEAIAEILKEFKTIRETKVSDYELAAAKNGLVLSLPGKFETVSAMASVAHNIFIYNLPLDYTEQWIEKVKEVTVENVLDAARIILKDNQMTMIAVGDLGSMGKRIEDMKIGDVSIVK